MYCEFNFIVRFIFYNSYDIKYYKYEFLKINFWICVGMINKLVIFLFYYLINNKICFGFLFVDILYFIEFFFVLYCIYVIVL